ncbi:MAG: hypothetical protein PVI92_09615 [Chromatiales bacterium]|jgi:hypothetical protein
MKSSADFLRELRDEIEATQVRRASYVKAKLAFVVSLIGVGSVSIGATKTVILLYLVPFVAYIFDMYVLGEDYGIRRAGRFIQFYPESPMAEVLWERTVSNYRDPFTKAAGYGSSVLVLAIAASLLYKYSADKTYWLWLIANIIVLRVVWEYGRHVDRKVEAFHEALGKQEKIIKQQGFIDNDKGG